MRLFARLFKKDQNKETGYLKKRKRSIDTSAHFGSNNLDFTDKSQREQFILSCCEQMLKSSRIMESSKDEYQQIVTTLSDIQQIENLPVEQRNDVFITIRNISRINRDRKKFQNSESPLSDGQYLHFEKFEKEIPDAIVELDKKEKYLRNIKNDMHQLEGEKGSLSYHRKELIGSQKNLKHLSVITLCTVIVIITMLVGAKIISNLRTKEGYLALAFAAGLAALSIFLKIRFNMYSIKKIELALNKAIQLLNKVKIKYVNITNEIEYIYEKYRINSCRELDYLWQMYIKEKNQKERYITTSRELELNTEELLRKLERFNIKKPGVFLYYTDSIVDSEKMNSLRIELHEKERTLRKKIDDNLMLTENAKSKITEFVNTYPEYGKETLELIDTIDSMEGIC